MYKNVPRMIVMQRKKKLEKTNVRAHSHVVKLQRIAGE